MCMENMAENGNMKVVCSCRRTNRTKWRPRKCIRSDGQKIRQRKTELFKATTKKYRLFDYNRRIYVISIYYQRRFVNCLEKAKNQLPPVVSEDQRAVATMAPRNTTQYLMDIVYQDLLSDRGGDVLPGDNQQTAIDLSRHSRKEHCYADSLSPQSVYASLERAYEGTLEFQQRDFENMIAFR